jgi:hypothetical protein
MRVQCLEFRRVLFRSGSVKRVASAVGEGSIAIRLVHDHLRGE